MTINSVSAERGTGDLFKDILADSDFRGGMTEAARMAGRTISAAWTRHRGNEVLVALARNALNARR
ncbi:hypothetical protein RZO50_14345 [Microbacterium sp. SSW1-59]|uniref:hypothetical protein n=1 Tax=Microbacterium xanthum TaxID=3079794 RepID=UPI002AD25EE9|nr:hypothetical protein [Microbacterium sp. SSW1-59]MDZ8202698.1 hypothetical protein [Microbacterium sp. SSW1-59]